MGVLTLQSLYSRPDALEDPDPLVRMSAIHHAGQRYRKTRDEGILTTLADLISDGDPLVRRYSAVTLAQNSDVRGVDWMLQSVMTSESDGGEISECLRASTRFPFLGLLSEHIDLRSITKIEPHQQEFLGALLRMNEDDFLDFAERDPGWRSDVIRMISHLDGIVGLRVKPGKMLIHGYVLSLANENRPGFVCAPATGGFFSYFTEASVNPRLLKPGKEALFIANPHDPQDEISSLYVLRDPEELPIEELSQQIVTTNNLVHGVAAGPLVPMLVIQRINSKKGMRMLGASGMPVEEKNYMKEAAIGQLALSPQPTSTESQNLRAHFVPGLFANPSVARSIIKKHAEQRNLKVGFIQVVYPKASHHKYLKVKIQIHSPSNPSKNFLVFRAQEGDRVLLEECGVCGTGGVVDCPDCSGHGKVACAGEFRCRVCKGTGKTRNGHKCTLCPQSHVVQGCEGSGVATCLVCNGSTKRKCVKCDGSGNFRASRDCPRCNATGRFKAGDCDSCANPGDGRCWICDGTGTKYNSTCNRCGGSGECQKCSGSGAYLVKCRTCEGSGTQAAIECERCRGAKLTTCRPCDGTGQRKCAVCFGQGEIRCTRCRGSGKLQCSSCRSAGWNIVCFIDKKVYTE